MAGGVDEAIRRRRATELLAVAAEARRRRAVSRVGSTASVLFETRLADGRWAGHAEDHVRVAAAAPSDRPLANVIAPVEVTGVDRVQSDLAVGKVRFDGG
jgi:tRNA A37 methylthiotransferase MiaB